MSHLSFCTKISEPLPEAICHPAIIENPSNRHQLLIFGGEKCTNIYIFDDTTNVFTKNSNDDLTTILHQRIEYVEAIHITAIKGDKPDTVLVLGDAFLRPPNTIRFHTISFYAIFNSISLKFEHIGNKIFDLNGIHKSRLKQLPYVIWNCNLKFEQEYSKAILGHDCINININNNNLKDETNNTKNDDDDVIVGGYGSDIAIKLQHLPFWTREGRINKYKNYIIVTKYDTIFVYDVIDNYNPQLIMYFNSDNKHDLRYHGAIILPSSFGVDMNFNINSSSDDCDHIVKILGFGGYGSMYKKSFSQSFYQISINLDALKLEIQELTKNLNGESSDNSKTNTTITPILTNVTVQSQADNDDNDICIQSLEKYSHIIKIIKSDCDDLSKALNLKKLIDASNAIKSKWYNFGAKLVNYGSFGFNLYNSRHLMIYDAHVPRKQPMTGIINFDFERKKWTICDNIWPDGSIWQRGHIIRKLESGAVVLQSMGGECDTMPGHTWVPKNIYTTKHVKIFLSRNLKWSIERLIWIAYLKGGNNSNLKEKNNICSLGDLPKDIILMMLTFLRTQFIFDSA